MGRIETTSFIGTYVVRSRVTAARDSVVRTVVGRWCAGFHEMAPAGRSSIELRTGVAVAPATSERPRSRRGSNCGAVGSFRATQWYSGNQIRIWLLHLASDADTADPAEFFMVNDVNASVHSHDENLCRCPMIASRVVELRNQG